MLKLDNVIGKKFNRLTVIKVGEKYISPLGSKKIRVYCECDCGNPELTLVPLYQLNNGRIKSCGCLQREKISETKGILKKPNRYDLTGEYGKGYDSNEKEFYFDLEDYDKIKIYCWRSHRNYIVSLVGDENISMHRLLMNFPKDKVIDHINRRPSDNRKVNLRICETIDNSKNKTISINNTSGTAGVTFQKRLNKWQADIRCDGERIYLGIFEDINDAIKTRKEAELQYFKEFAPLPY